MYAAMTIDTTMHRRRMRRERGVSMIEVLIALLILSVGLLGLAGLQNSSLQFNHSASLRTQATNYANDMADRMRVNRNAAIDGHYNIGLGDALPSGNTLPATDVKEWLESVRGTLPDGDAAIDIGSNGVGTITVEWDDTRGEGDKLQFEITVRL